MLKKFLIVLLPLLILLSNFYFLIFNESFYLKESEKFNQQENKHIYQNVIDYLQNKEPLNYFSEKEKTHMVDVKNLVQKTIYLFYFSLISTILLIAYLIYKKQKFTSEIILSSILTITILFILSITIYLSFEKLFLYFHLILFNNNLWILNPQTDLLINLFPKQFFIDFTKRLIISSTLTSFIILIISATTKYLKNKKVSLFQWLL